MKALVFAGSASLLFFGAGAAYGQEDAATRAGEATEGAVESAAEPIGAATESTVRFFDSRGISVAAGGGVVDFTNDDTQSFIDTGGAYQVRALVGTRSRVGFEVAYVGTASDINALGLDPSSTVLSNGVEGAVRFNFSASKWQPYVLAGATWKRYVVVNDSFNTSAVVNNSDGVFEIPLGGGLTWHLADRGEKGLIVDGRFDYRLSSGEDLLGGRNGGGPGLNNWQVTAKAGYEF